MLKALQKNGQESFAKPTDSHVDTLFIQAQTEYLREDYQQSEALLAQRLQEAWDQPECRQTVAKRNWALVQEKGSYHKNMGVIESALRQLIQDKKGRGRR